MTDWPYSFQALPVELRRGRRLTLDRYGQYAQLLVLVPVAIALVFRIVGWASRAAKERYQAYDAIPDSPSLKSSRQSVRGAWATRLRQLRWWLGGDVFAFGRHWGQRDQWIFGTAWLALLLSLCFPETGKDYLHFVKRFGIVAASQFPVQYLLALKYMNPIAFVFRSSHEQVNRWHRVLGRVIYTMLWLHAVFYFNFFVGVGIFVEKMLSPVVMAGVVAFILLIVLNTTALSVMRSYSYRLFFIVHLVAAFAMPPILFIHARPARVYLAEAFLIFVVDLVTRKLSSVTTEASLEAIPGTNLIKISAPISPTKANQLREHPGSHIYLNIPETAPLWYNPFTVAAVNDETGDVTLVARQLTGPTSSALAKFAARSSPALSNRGEVKAGDGGAKLSLSIEGPYGAVRYFPNLAGSHFDRILLVAGGVGATFAVPIYRAVVHDNPNVKLDFVWAVRSAGDATWAVEGDGSEGRSILSDKNVHIFLTGDLTDAQPNGETGRTTRSSSQRATESAGGGSGGVELSPMYRDRQRGQYTTQHNRRRPDLKKIVDEVFKHGGEERVAVLVCGPGGMARELRDHVSHWVMRGRSVWFHDESFGF